jgi:hypothetical protein
MRMDSPNNTVCTVPQSVRYHKLLPSSVLRPAYQPGRATWRVGSLVYVCWSVHNAFLIYLSTVYYVAGGLGGGGEGGGGRGECLFQTHHPSLLCSTYHYCECTFTHLPAKNRQTRTVRCTKYSGTTVYKTPHSDFLLIVVNQCSPY